MVKYQHYFKVIPFFRRFLSNDGGQIIHPTCVIVYSNSFLLYSVHVIASMNISIQNIHMLTCTSRMYVHTFTYRICGIFYGTKFLLYSMLTRFSLLYFREPHILSFHGSHIPNFHCFRACRCQRLNALLSALE